MLSCPFQLSAAVSMCSLAFQLSLLLLLAALMRFAVFSISAQLQTRNVVLVLWLLTCPLLGSG